MSSTNNPPEPSAHPPNVSSKPSVGRKPRVLRGRIISIRALPSEADAWSARASEAGVSLSDYIRQTLVASQPSGGPNPTVSSNLNIHSKRRRRPALEIPLLHPAALSALARAGNNLNQIARWAQTYKAGMSALAVVSALVQLERALNQVAHNGPSAGLSPLDE